MAIIRISCPRCAARYKTDDSHRGKRGRCDKCGASFVIGDNLAGVQVTAAGRLRGEDGIPRDWEPGDVIIGQYEVTKLPGPACGYVEGGMGRVNLVRHREWQRDIAVKSVLPGRSASASAIKHFTTEAEQWVATIGLHPNVVACHYVRELGGAPRVFMEYVDGGALSEWITSKRLYNGGPTTALTRILDIAIQTAWGLDYVHELGLVHQDVKPDNVMMTADGVAKITDFGLAGAKATAFEDGDRPPGGTILATWGGLTPAYCSPEQAEIAAKKAVIPRESWPKLTRRTDVWSWAASVLHMFLGEIAWPAGQVAHVGLQREPDGLHLPAMPPPVQELLLACFQKWEEDRPRGMMQLADRLTAIYQQLAERPYPRDKPRPQELLADTLNNRAVSLMDLKKQEAAETKWQEAIHLDPHHPEATYNWGLIRWRSAQMTDQKLLEKLRETLSTSTSVGRVGYLIGLVHLERADAHAAVELLSKAGGAPTDRPDVSAALALARTAGTSVPLRTFKGHTDDVGTLSFSPDGQFAISGSLDKTLRLWDVSSGGCLRTFEGHTGSVDSVSFNPDGRLALSGSSDKTMRLWELSSGRCLRTFEGHTSAVKSVSFSAGTLSALSGSGDKTLRLWDVSSGMCLRVYKARTGAVYFQSFSPDGRLALSAADKALKALTLWEVASGECLFIFEGHSSAIRSASFGQDGRLAITGSLDKTLRLWEVASGNCIRTFEGHTTAVSAVTLSPDGRFALSGGWDKTVRLWDVSSGRCLRTFEGHTNAVKSVSFSADGSLALSGSGDRTLRLWGVASSRHSAPLIMSRVSAVSPLQYEHYLQQTQASLASQPAVAASFLQRAREQPGCLRRENALELARKLSRALAHHHFVGGWEKRTFGGHTSEVRSVSFSPDGHFALSGHGDNRLRLWDVSSGSCLRTLGGHTGWVNSVSFSPDGSFALSGSWDKTLRLWNVSSGECLRVFDGHTSEVTSVSFSPDGRLALSGSGDKTLRLWDVSSGKCFRTFKGHTQSVTSASFMPDGNFAISGAGDEVLLLWEVPTGRCRCLHTFARYAASVSFSPDGRFALTANGNTLWLLDVPSGRPRRTFEGHTEHVSSVSFSPDGNFAVSGGWDKTVRLWEVSTGRCLRTFEGHTGWVSSVSFSPEGRFALSGSKDETLRLWELDWEFELNQPADWDEGARPFLAAFLTRHTPLDDTLNRRGKPAWNEDDFRRLLSKLGCAGYGWLRSQGIRHELEKMAATHQSPLAILP